MSGELLTRVGAYYGQKLADHGATPAGVDWSSAESQTVRFQQLARIYENPGDYTLLDYGCGYGAFAGYLRQTERPAAYVGYDIVPEMVTTATALYGDATCRFSSRRDDLQPADFTVASGIFNVKLNTPVEEWSNYVLATLDDIASLSTRGFAFNALTVYSDEDRRRDYLYYADPCTLFDHCKRRYSRLVTLVHDYLLWEFTILVRLGEAPRG